MPASSLNGAVIVFDLDGTLVDTAPDLLRALNQTLALEGLPPAPADDVRGFVGHGARAMIERATRDTPRSPKRLAELTDAFVEFYAADIAGASRPFPGTEAMLDALAAQGALLAVCTNKRQALSERLLTELGLADRFAAIVGSDAVKNRKPDPEHYREAVRRAGGRVERSLMVGDSAPDVQAAKAAGAPVVVVRFGYTGGPAEALGADFVIDAYSELPAQARRLIG